jgi:tetratricopeptide (TPR) repeat protein
MKDILGFSAEGLARAKKRIDTGIELVGEHPLLLVALGAWHWQAFNAGFDVSEARIEDAHRYFERALATDPELPQAHVMVGWIHGSRANIVDGFRSLYRALRKDPHHAHALALLGVLSWMTGRQAEMREFVSRLRAIDPFDLYGLLIGAFLQAASGDREQRDTLMRQAFSVSGAPAALFFHGLVCAQDGERDNARAHWSRPELLAEDDLFKWLSQAGVAALDGNSEPAKALVDHPNMSALAAHDAQWGWHLSEVLALAGHAEQALDALAQAVNNGLSNVVMIESRDAMLAAVRNHHRFPSILAKAKRLDAELDAALREIKGPGS